MTCNDVWVYSMKSQILLVVFELLLHVTIFFCIEILFIFSWDGHGNIGLKEF